MNDASPSSRASDTKRRLRSILWRIALLIILVILGVFFTYRTSPLNVLNLFSIPISDDQTKNRVAEQVGLAEKMHSVAIDGRTLTLPEEFTIERFVTSRGKLRMMAATADGYLLVTEMDRGNVLGYPLSGGDPMVVVSGLDTPSGIAVHDGYLWVAEHHRITRYQYLGNARMGSQQVVVATLPPGGNHVTRTIGFGSDGLLYVTIGSSCNVCEESDRRRAAMVRYHPDGTGEEIFAEGLRNTVGFAWQPESGEIWGVDNGRDLIGDDLPPEEVNVIAQAKHYGWPFCYGRGGVNPEYRNNRDEFCLSTEFPTVEMQAHSAPLGVRFYEQGNWPSIYKHSFFIAFHGSWNRTIPTGYKVVRVATDGKVYDFVTGWLASDDEVWGRPVDILFIDDAMYISDDGAGTIWKVRQE